MISTEKKVGRKSDEQFINLNFIKKCHDFYTRKFEGG